MRRLGAHYVLHTRLGAGATGEVWRGEREADGTPVAVKILRSELADDHEIVDRFLRERRLLLTFDHPHLVKVRDLVAESGTLAIVMDLVEGSDLRGYLRQRGRLAPAEAIALTSQVLDALADVHRQGVVHRDIKPENILVDTSDPANPRVLLTDFGIARLTHGPTMTRITGLIGTPRYMAPELSDGESATPSTDLYSVGVVLYELLSGRPPFDGSHPMAVLRAHLEQQPAPLTDLPDALWAAIAALLAKSPSTRPRTADQARQALTAALPAGTRPTDTTPLGTLPLDGQDADEPGDTTVITSQQGDATVLTPQPPAIPPAPANPTLVTVHSPLPVDPQPQPPTQPPTQPQPQPGERRRPGWPVWVGLTAAAAVLITVGSWALAAGGGDGKDTADGTTVNATTGVVPTASATETVPPTAKPTPSTTSAPPVGTGQATVPSVLNQTLANASASLRRNGFTNIPYLYDCYGGTAGQVVRQEPGAGTRQDPSSPVHLYLEANNCATVPDVQGLTLEAAANLLKQRGLNDIPYVYECLGSNRLGTVVSQSPAAGTHLVTSNSVRLRLQANNC